MKLIKEIRLAIALLLVTATAVFAGKGFNSGKAFPYIANDEESAMFIASSILWWAAEQSGQDPKDAVKDAEDAAEDYAKGKGGETMPYLQYSRNLASTLSTLSPAEQDLMFYGDSSGDDDD